jgi:hypothetical protein
MLHVNAFQRHVAARLLDFFNWVTPWHRWLWSPGVVLTLKEVLEASEAVHVGVLSEGALRNLLNTAVTLAGPDPGTGTAEQKRLLQQSLKSDFEFRGLDYLTVQQITEDIEGNYLGRWAIALNETGESPDPERTARAISSHLLDAGLSSDFLHRWWTFKIRHEGAMRSLPELVAEAHELVRRTPRDYRVLVAFEAAPAGKSGMPPRWLDAPTVSEWLRTNGFDVTGIRQTGGVWIAVSARDAWSAVEAAGETVDRLTARVAVGTHGQLTPIQSAWVAGEKRLFQLRRRRRRVEVHALHREDQLYSDAQTSIVDAAIELLGPLASGSPSPAVAGGWAAIEALLSGPGDAERAMAGDRMASLVACSFPRAELTALSYRIEEAGGDIAHRLRLCSSNRDRADVIAKAVQSGEALILTDDSDVAALARVRALLADPYRTLHDIESHAAAAFRRLYRQRNMVLHGGKTDAVALRASLRTAAPLVGAGMDRIAHAWFVDRVMPLELAARARIRLALVGSSEGVGCVDLLG